VGDSGIWNLFYIINLFKRRNNIELRKKHIYFKEMGIGIL
jgi:hypothetical protein